MYNRYLRNDEGVYTRIPMQDVPQDSPPRNPPPPPPQHGEMPHGDAHHNGKPHNAPPHRDAAGDEQFLHRLLGKFNLKDIDTADILLLLILFFLPKDVLRGNDTAKAVPCQYLFYCAASSLPSRILPIFAAMSSAMPLCATSHA